MVPKRAKCASFCSHKFKTSNETKACFAGCLQVAPKVINKKIISPPLLDNDDKLTRLDVEYKCYNNCYQNYGFWSYYFTCAYTCLRYDQKKGIKSCICGDSDSLSNVSCRVGCQFMDDYWKLEGGWK